MLSGMIRSPLHRTLLALALFVPASSLFGYPEMIRHGYVNCTSCHLSPNGGGMLTDYGRSLSAEVLSSWGKEDEGRFLHGAIRPPSWLSLGGDVRWVQTLKDTATVRSGRLIWMQADIEAAATVDKWRAVASIGKSGNLRPNTVDEALVSRRHYVMYQASDQLAFRAGRFFTAYGINLADHTAFTRSQLGWDQGGETYNLEASWLGDTFDAYLTGILGRPDLPSRNTEKGFAARAGYGFLERFKVGVGYLFGSHANYQHHLFGPYALLGITERFFILAELGFQSLSPKPAGAARFGYANYLRADYELFKGFHVFLTQELARLDERNAATQMSSYGLGLQFFPRPHFEMILHYQRQRVRALSPDFYHLGSFMFHYYL